MRGARYEKIWADGEEDTKALRNDLGTFKGYQVDQGAWTDILPLWVPVAQNERDRANKQG